MRKEDFKKGQAVWLYLVGNAARGKKDKEERIKEYEVISVGRKYITVQPKEYGWEVRFEIENNFRQVTDTCVDYLLFLKKEDIYLMLERTEKINLVEKAFQWEKRIYSKLSDEDLDTTVEIVKKYLEK